MALSTCVKCGSHSFEAVMQEPKGANFKMQFIQCASCGGVVGVMDFYYISRLLQNMAAQLNIDPHKS